MINTNNDKHIRAPLEPGSKDGAATHRAPLRAPQELVPFTGKEKDVETGCHAQFPSTRSTGACTVGARYYDSDISGLFLSIDPMVDKYPSISPLIATHKSALRAPLELVPYCAWNPMKLVDPDGRTIWIENSDGTKIKYEANMKAQGDEFSQQTIETLNEMYTTKAGKKLLNSLSDSKKNFYISNESSSLPETHSTTKYKDGARSKMGGSSSMLDLSHESFHQYQFLCGQGGATYLNEVEAYLFSERLTFDYNTEHGKWFSTVSSLMSRHPNTKRGETFETVTSFLRYSSVFSGTLFEFVVKNFKDQSGANATGVYNTSYYKERTGKERHLLFRFYEPFLSSKY